jgi:Peptidase family C25
LPAAADLVFHPHGPLLSAAFCTLKRGPTTLNLLLFLLPLVAIAAPPAGPDTLVVCPGEFRPALVEWEKFRREQGHVVAVVDVPASAEQVKAAIRSANRAGALKYVVLIGDEPSAKDSRIRAAQVTVPTNYVPAKVNIRWGPEKEIASDTPYGDVDGDGVPDVAVGRIPAHSAAELAAVVHKVIRYEELSDHGPWEKCLNIVSGAGGFGAVTDAMVEAAGRQVIRQTVPPEYDVRHIFAASANTDGEEKTDFVSRARGELNGGGLAWIYVGHGMPTELIYAATASGYESLLSMRDVPQLHCSPHNPLAVLVACYTGAMDAPHGCLGEELLLAEEGPVAVIAATRVTMPYGNTIMGCELLRACFQDRPVAVGDVLRLAQRRVLVPVGKDEPNMDQLRATLDGMAEVMSPPPVDLAAERREHVLMYQLIGDPLLRLHLPAARVAQVAPGAISK